MIFFIIFGGLIYLLFTYVAAVGIDDYNDSHCTKDSVFVGVLNYFGINPTNEVRKCKRDYSTHTRDHYCYDLNWAWVWLFFWSLLPAYFILDVTIGSIYRKHQKSVEKKKSYIHAGMIYDFLAGDRILLKNGNKVTLGKFSQLNFADKNKKVYSWNDVKANETCNERKIIQDQNNVYMVFEKEADTFEQKRKSFQDALSEQRKKIEEQYK